MKQWAALNMCSESHADGITYAVGPFDTHEEAESHILEHGYVVEIRSIENTMRSEDGA